MQGRFQWQFQRMLICWVKSGKTENYKREGIGKSKAHPLALLQFQLFIYKHYVKFESPKYWWTQDKLNLAAFKRFLETLMEGKNEVKSNGVKH